MNGRVNGLKKVIDEFGMCTIFSCPDVDPEDSEKGCLFSCSFRQMWLRYLLSRRPLQLLHGPADHGFVSHLLSSEDEEALLSVCPPPP